MSTPISKHFVFLLKDTLQFQLSEGLGSPLGPCISRHFNNRKAGCLDATIKIGMEVTVFRFWIFNEKYQLIVLEGETQLFNKKADPLNIFFPKFTLCSFRAKI